jgi:hypothetical protein
VFSGTPEEELEFLSSEPTQINEVKANQDQFKVLP